MLKVNNLTFSYNNFETISDINFSVKKGELTCLLGANGSGKTTILKCLNKILKPDKGRVMIEGVDITALTPREIAHYISMVPQEHRVVFAYPVIEVVVMGYTPYLSFGRMPGRDVYIKAEKILKELGINHLKDIKYNELSGGERQLVLIARALLQNTPLLILDEPTAHLDFKNQFILMKKIKELTGYGKSVITALHDPNLAMRFCDRVILLKEGKVLGEGNTRDMINEENLRLTYDFEVVLHDLMDGLKMVFPDLN